MRLLHDQTYGRVADFLLLEKPRNDFPDRQGCPTHGKAFNSEIPEVGQI